VGLSSMSPQMRVSSTPERGPTCSRWNVCASVLPPSSMSTVIHGKSRMAATVESCERSRDTPHTVPLPVVKDSEGSHQESGANVRAGSKMRHKLAPRNSLGRPWHPAGSRRPRTLTRRSMPIDGRCGQRRRRGRLSSWYILHRSYSRRGSFNTLVIACLENHCVLRKL
jgi:hypothetical protein